MEVIKKPIKWKVEASPYFWWWYALTLNGDYKELCEQKVREEALLTKTADREKQLQVYEDFEDVGYTGCRYVAFASWWTKRVNILETRGDYLFAEPYIVSAVRRVDTLDHAEAALGSGNVLLLSIKLDRQRKYIDKDIDRILKRYLHTVKSRAVRNPKFSARRVAELRGEQITNW